ncbi:hypothetical protein BN903_2 [Halorubrum sp. AJ67]|nr:hypothetical protein BN903_2 [Halorubrum sp. AJ67]
MPVSDVLRDAVNATVVFPTTLENRCEMNLNYTENVPGTLPRIQPETHGVYLTPYQQ